MQIGNRDLDKLNPDWRFAYFHAKSTRPGICTDQQPQHCQCCLNIIHKEPVSIGVHSKDLEFLGFGFPLWYCFLKYCIILTVILIVSESTVSVFQAIHMNKQMCIDQFQKIEGYIPQADPIRLNVQEGQKKQKSQESHRLNLLRNFNSHNSYQLGQQKINHHTINQQSLLQNVHMDEIKKSGSQGESLLSKKKPAKQGQQGGQQQKKCTGFFILLSRIDAQIDDLQTIMRVTTFIIVMFTLIFIRDTVYKTQQYYDERRTSIGDYSILLTQVPNTVGIQAQIRNFFQKGMGEPYKIQELILVPGYQELQEIHHQKDEHLKKLKEFYKKGKQDHEHQIHQIEEELQKIQQKQQQAVNDFSIALRQDKLISQTVIIVMQSQPQKDKFLREFQSMQNRKENLQSFFGMQGGLMQANQAPQPKQIIWENFNYPTSKRFGKVLLGWTLSIVFIAIITLIFYFILQHKSQIVEHQKDLTKATIIVFTALISVIFFNKFIMGNVLHHFTHLQKHATSDTEQFSFAFKYALGMFFTTALMTLLVEAVKLKNFYQSHYGVIEQQSIMFFMNSFFVPVIWAINPFQIVILIKRKLNFGKTYFTQRQANTLMQDFTYDVGKRYAQVLQTMWFTFLYVSLIPMGSFLTVIGIGLYYWVDKYNLLRRSSIKQNVSGKLSIIALTLLDLVLVMLPLGQIIFDYYLRHEFKKTSGIMLLVSIIYLALPLNKMIDFFNKQNFFLQDKKYKEVKDTFRQNYYNLHPIYSKLNPQQHKESRRLYKESVIKQFGNPVFSFVAGWLLGKEPQGLAKSKNKISGVNTGRQIDVQGSRNQYQSPAKRGLHF